MSATLNERPGRPDCGHTLLMECPLDVRDWEEVFNAYCVFRLTCRAVSERARERAERKRKR